MTEMPATDPDLLAPSSWTVEVARDLVGQARHAARSPEEYAAAELFEALCDYADDLYGADGFGFLLEPDQRREVATLVGRVLADRDSDDEDRLDQPVNAAVTLAGGRELARQQAASTGWQGELGKALLGLYGYLDDLHGGPGAFTELLTPDECATVAAGRTVPGP